MGSCFGHISFKRNKSRMISVIKIGVDWPLRMLETVYLKKIFERASPCPHLACDCNTIASPRASPLGNWVRADKGFCPGLTGALWSLRGLHAEDGIRRNARSVTEGSARWEGGKRKVETPLFPSFHRSWFSPAHVSLMRSLSNKNGDGYEKVT